MEVFRADLTPLRDELFEKIEAEVNPVVQAKLIGLMQHLTTVDLEVVNRLMGLLKDDSSSLQRVAVVKVLGSWLANPELQRDSAVRLQSFLSSDSARVRRAALDQLANCDDSVVDRVSVFRKALTDTDSNNVRCAMWHLCRLQRVTDSDLEILLSAGQPDRVSAETLLAMAANQPRTVCGTGQVAPKGRLTESVLQWSQHHASRSG
jgi:hypothetical protein